MRLLLAILVLMNSCLAFATSTTTPINSGADGFGQYGWLIAVLGLLVVVGGVYISRMRSAMFKTMDQLRAENTTLVEKLSRLEQANRDPKSNQSVHNSPEASSSVQAKGNKQTNKSDNYEKLATLGSITAGVAHEVNNPNNFVNLSADMLGKELSTVQQYLLDLAGEDADPEIIKSFKQKFEPLFTYLDTIKDGSERIKIIVDGLRDYTQQSDGQLKQVNITDLISSTVRLVQSQYKKTIEFKLHFKQSPTVQCYPAKLNQIFMNLVVNACHAIEQGCANCDVKTDGNCSNDFIGAITISCEQIDWQSDDGQAIDMVEITVTDTGCGMTEETKAKLFEPYYTTKGNDKGTGLGLSISADIVAEHHGQLLVESQLNRGTTFILRIPIKFQ